MLPFAAFRRIYKISAGVLLSYALIAGLLTTLPDMGGNMAQTSRNVFYHVPQWFCLYLMMGISFFYSIKVLRSNRKEDDLIAFVSARLGLFFGLLGLSTGILWSRVTWRETIASNDISAWWGWDPKQTLLVIALMIYLAYFILRGTVEEVSLKHKISAVYNIFACACLIPLTYIMPRILGGLHPGGESNPLDNISMSNDFRLIFYPSVLGFICLALWLLELNIRFSRILNK